MTADFNQHLSVLEAQIDLMRGQIAAMRFLMNAQKARPELPEECQGIRNCGKVDPEARAFGMGGGTGWLCRGCGKRCEA